MKHTSKLLLLFLSSFLLINCNKISKNVGLNVNGDVIKHAVSLQFWDPKAPTIPPADLFVKITGKDANKVYEFGGTKNFTVTNGILNLGLDPFVKPTPESPVSFTVEVFATNYMSVKVPVTIDGSKSQQRVTVAMINTKNPPAGVTVKQTEVTVNSDGSSASDVVLTTPTNGSTPEAMSITIPEGTKFKAANGSTIQPNGASLIVTQVFYSSNTSASLNAFPQSSFVSDSITDANGNKRAGYFQTAGFSSIEMSLNGQEVKFFTNPITVDIDIKPTYVTPDNNQVAAGTVVPIYSYDVTKNRWSFEQNVALTNVNGKLVASFPTTHLTYFAPAWVGTVCGSTTNITFNTGSPVTTSYLVDVFSANGDQFQPVIAGMYFTVADGVAEAVGPNDLPAGNIILKVYPNNVNNSQFDWTVRDATPLTVYNGTACGGNITLNLPSNNNYPPIYFNIVGSCPGGLTVYPTVPTYYKPFGANVPYTLLGTVVNGQFTTTNLQLGSKYDFMWLYKNRTFKLSRLVDSTSYTRVKPVPERFVGDTLRDIFCY